MAAMQFARGDITRQGRPLQRVVSSAHSALGGGCAILLYGHDRNGLESSPIVAKFRANASPANGIRSDNPAPTPIFSSHTLLPFAPTPNIERFTQAGKGTLRRGRGNFVRGRANL